MTALRVIALWASAVVFPLPLMLVYDAISTEPVVLKQLVLFAIIAYCWWLLAILLSVRPRWLDRFVGLPAVYRLHGVLGIGALVLAYIHDQNSYTSNRLARTLGDWGLYGAIATLCLAVFFLSGWLVDRSVWLLRARRWCERVLFRRQLSLWLHRLNFVVVLLIWLHVHLLARMNQYALFMILFDFYTVMVLSIYVWKKWVAPGEVPRGTVVSNEARGTSTRRISIELDETNEAIRPGDFFFLAFDNASEISCEAHPFSATDADQNTVTFTIRQQGDYTDQLSDVAVGTRARLEGPFGRFDAAVQQYDQDAPIVLLGMGAGVAPLLSLTAAHHTRRPIRLLWSVRTVEDLYYRDVLDEYQAASEGKLQVTTSIGRFTPEDLNRELAEDVTRTGAFFIVGPSPAVLASQRLLRKMGVSRSRIHQERLM
ncbi:FAD-binding oxidoreductase [Corynebacterium glyciniphilum]|uniref:FAD-binding oxidoreductase n=1 Tax=Corynebacterium glyciniphilum TaxID=1404244 RepID=UPI003D9FD934